MLKKLLLASGIMLGAAAYAQHAAPPGTKCTTHSHEEEYFRQNPGAKQDFERYNKEILRKAAQMAIDQNMGKSANGTQAARFIIPVVVHIIMPPGLGNYPWVSDAQVHDCIRIMNEDFQKLNRDTSQVIARFRPIIGNASFEFRLATRDPQGNPTNGITRTISEQSNSAGDGVKALSRWPHNMYYNIWVVNNIASGAGGYAYRPGTTSTQNEGVVCRASQFGGIGLSCGSNFCDRTMTHETGHFFNLPHTWGGTNEPGEPTNCSIDDGIQDTPNTVGVTGQNCNTNMAACAGDPSPVANVQNYMDYSSCGIMFTQGQANVMVAAAQSSRGSRNTLWTPNNLIATGTADPYTWQQVAPKAVMVSNIRTVCSDGTVALNGWVERLAKDSTARITWLTPGAIQASYTGNPASARYAAPGRYSVQMVAANSFGADTTALMVVANVLPGDTVLRQPFAEGFETAGWPNLDPDTNRIWKQYRVGGTANLAWSTSNLASTGGNSSLSLRMFNQNGTTWIESPNISTRGLTTNMRLFYKMAFIPRTINYGDQFEVSLSADCGQTWQTVKTYNRTSTPTLATTTGTYNTISSPWVPSAAAWRTETALISSIRTRSRFKVRLEMAAVNGAGFYLDDINVGAAAITSLGTPDAPGFMLSVYPNPGTENSIMAFRTVQDDNVTVSIYNAAGAIMGSTVASTTGGEDRQITLREVVGRTLPAGVYSIKLSNGRAVHTEKLIVQ